MFLIPATPFLDFAPISEILTFTAGQSRGDSLCVPVFIYEDVFVEAQETFEVALLPTPEDFFKVLIISGRDRATVIISDGEKDRSTFLLDNKLVILQWGISLAKVSLNCLFRRIFYDSKFHTNTPHPLLVYILLLQLLI